MFETCPELNVVVIFWFFKLHVLCCTNILLICYCYVFSRIAMPCNNTSHCLFNCSIVFLSLLSTSFLFFATTAYRLAICLKMLYCNMSSLEIEIDHRCTMYTVHLFTIFDACREVANILNLGSLTIYREPGCTLLLLCVTSLEI